MTPTIHAVSRLVPFRDGTEHAAVHPNAWFITHGEGTPAARTFTEVTFADGALTDRDGRPLPKDVLAEAVRVVADSLYRDRWAFLYPPEEYLSAVEVYGLGRRERVHVEHIDVW